MLFEDLKKRAASLQWSEEPRKAIQAKALLSILDKARSLNNPDRLTEEILISMAAEDLFTIEQSSLQALSKITGAADFLTKDALIRSDVFSNYILAKWDFSKTQEAVEKYFLDELSFDEFRKCVRLTSFYRNIDDRILEDVYEILMAKSLV